MALPILILGKQSNFCIIVFYNYTLSAQALFFYRNVLVALPNDDDNWKPIDPSQDIIKTIGQKLTANVVNENKFQFNGYGDCDKQVKLDNISKASVKSISNVRSSIDYIIRMDVRR